MKKTITASDFQREFEAYGRGDQFSYEGRQELFSYLEDMEDGCGEELELDVIAICCDFSEYDTAQEAAEETVDLDPYDLDGRVDSDTAEAEYVEILREHGTVIELSTGGVIVSP